MPTEGQIPRTSCTLSLSTTFYPMYNYLWYSDQYRLTFNFSFNSSRTYINEQMEIILLRDPTTIEITCSCSANSCSLCCKFHSLLVTYSQDLFHLPLFLSQSQSHTLVTIKNTIFCIGKRRIYMQDFLSIQDSIDSYLHPFPPQDIIISNKKTIKGRSGQGPSRLQEKQQQHALYHATQQKEESNPGLAFPDPQLNNRKWCK